MAGQVQRENYLRASSSTWKACVTWLAGLKASDDPQHHYTELEVPKSCILWKMDWLKWKEQHEIWIPANVELHTFIMADSKSVLIFVGCKFVSPCLPVFDDCIAFKTETYSVSCFEGSKA